MDELKSVQKSVRLRPRIYQKIDEYRGDGFNEKLDNLVSDYIDKHDDLVRDWSLLQAAISDKRAELRNVQEHLRRVRNVDVRFGPLVDTLLELMREV